MIRDIAIDNDNPSVPRGTADGALQGTVYVLRNGLGAFGLLDPLIEASLRGIRKSAGDEVADNCVREGFEQIHKWVSPGHIPEVAEAVYREIQPLAPSILTSYIRQAFPDKEHLYYEEVPNVRFHIPYDLAKAHQDEYKSFSKNRGEGKITAHGPHRDSWLDCPSNGVNLWFAIGPVKKGNGLTIYTGDYGGDFRYKNSGDIAEGESLHEPSTFDLAPGDGILFHTDHVHGSELNRTDETRFVISFRLSFDKPHFPNRHFHRYVRADLVNSPLKAFAAAPAMMQPSYPRSLVTRIREKLTGLPADAPAREPEVIGREQDGKLVVPLSDVPVGAVRGISPALCVARVSETDVVAVSRRCPHAGGDLANGWAKDGQVVCPWHNLPFDAKTGRSPCQTLPALIRVHAEIVGEQIVVNPTQRLKDTVQELEGA
ncbi:Rieske 2Fe-2S domain-containing protein [Parvularcula lutaonensis]|uniref:Rieske 2Fe-2S domain-containing protein n=1 Tax=Parvularcula lutaonensis TaxID=491923 RepID=A0ABV7MAC3_9PROT|nr:Rieske 2Fe-2S domain-containing protein [Parvularcula lutaonensis]GGY44474.1 hypothetical protein GCM10007148_11730 [Parvularcula lutaonensis]